MAKIRVYELARDLNMTNKVLLEKLKEIGLPIKSHMSSLEEEKIDAIKAAISGVDPVDVEVVRIKPNVIRRRKRAATKPDIEPIEVSEETQDMQEASKDQEAVEKIPVEKGEEDKADDKVVAEIVSTKKTSPIKSIKRSEKEAEATEMPLAADVEESEAEPSVDVIDLSEKKSVTEKTEDKSETKKQKPGKKTKKQKKDKPAKIIKLAVPPIEKPVEKEVVLKKPDKKDAGKPDHTPKDVEALAKEDNEKEKKGLSKKKPSEAAKDKKFFKKKISFRSKEVVITPSIKSCLIISLALIPIRLARSDRIIVSSILMRRLIALGTVIWVFMPFVLLLFAALRAFLTRVRSPA